MQILILRDEYANNFHTIPESTYGFLNIYLKIEGS